MSHSVILRMKNISERAVEKTKTHILYPVFLFLENRALYEIMWKNIVQLDRPQMTTLRMRTACWIPRATNTLIVYNIYCFSATKWLHKRASILSYT